MNQYILAIDKGSTNTKVVLFNTQGQQVFAANAANDPPQSPREGWWEFDTRNSWNLVSAQINFVLQQGYKADEIIGVIVAGHGNGMILLDADHSPVRPGVLSLDNRASEIVDQWKTDGRYDQAATAVQLPFAVGSPGPLFAWFKAHQSEDLERAKHLLFPKDWIRFCLTGEIFSDYTDASGSGLLNPLTQRYAEDIFDLLDISDITDLLPPLKHSHESAGLVTTEAAAKTGLNAATPVFIGAHDICATPVGVSSLSDRVLVSTFGTWSVNVIASNNAADLSIVLNHPEPGYFLTGIADGNAGACLDTMIQMFFADYISMSKTKGVSVYSLLEDLIQTSDKNRLLFVPHLFGNMLDSDASAALIGLRGDTDRLCILKAVYEGILLGYRVNLGMVPQFANVDNIWVTGGGSKSDVMGQLMADILERDVHTPVESELVARGVAINALRGLGMISSCAQIDPPAIRRTYRPDKTMGNYYGQKAKILERIMQNGNSMFRDLSAIDY